MPSKGALDDESTESTKDLRDHVFTVFNNVYGELRTGHDDNERFEEHLKRHDQMLGTLHNDNERFEEHLKRHDQMLGTLHNDNERFEQHLKSLAAQTTNPRAVRPMQKVQPVGISTATQAELLFPNSIHFPTTVKQFWNLKVEDLTYLCEFYQVTSEELVGEYQSDSESDTDTKSSSTTSSVTTSASVAARQQFRAAVEQHREMAQLCLADRLQLNFGLIKYHMETLALVRKQTDEREHRGLKRSVKDGEETAKRLRSSPKKKMPDNTSTRYPEPKAWSAGYEEKLKRMVPGSEYEGLLHAESPHSPQDFVRWASQSLSDRRYLKDDPDALPDIPSSKSDTKPSHHALPKGGNNTEKKQRNASTTPQGSQASTQVLTNTPSAYQGLTKTAAVEHGSPTSVRSRP